MANGRRRTTRAAPTRRNGNGRRGNGGGRRGQAYREPPPGPQGLHPGLIVALVAIPLILLVAVIIAVSSGGGDTPQTEPQEAYVAPTPPPPPPPRVRPDRPKPVPRPSKAELDTLERQWDPLRAKVERMRSLRDEGTAAWRAENHELMQEKFHEAKLVWQDVRDTAERLLSRFTDAQVDKYLVDYEREQIQWRKIWASFQKSIAVDR
jgi:hypothetical protein